MRGTLPLALLLTVLAAPVPASAQPAVAQSPADEPSIHTVIVRARRPTALDDYPAGSVPRALEPDAVARPAAGIAELLVRLPGVVESGQGGWMQTITLGGMSRQRVLSLLGGIPILTDRRAGTAVHFVDPALLDAAQVLAGPAAGVIGTGALGGLVQLQPRTLDGATAGLQFDDNRNGRGAWAGWGDEDTTLMLAGLHRGNSEAADGRRINDRGERVSALLQQRVHTASGELELLAMPARLEDLGRANANYYDGRITRTPREEHLPLRAAWRAASGWEAAGFLHHSDVGTGTERIGVDRTTVDNAASDAGLNLLWPFHAAGLRGRLGADLLLRTGVDADERLLDFASGTLVRREALADGEERQLGVHAMMETPFAGGRAQWGLRYGAQQQSARREPHADDADWAAYLGWERPFGEHLWLGAGAGRAVRFPALTERFYRGTTGRGTLSGNAALDPETALSADLGARLALGGATLGLRAFGQRVDDYIEQVVLVESPLAYSFANLGEGRIEGVELEGHWPLAGRIELSLAAHRIRGEDAHGTPLADMPADRLRLGLSRRVRDCSVELGWSWRRDKDDPGPDELPLEAVDHGEAAIGCRIGGDWHVELSVANAGDADYLLDADTQSGLAPGRRVALRIRWR